MLSRQARAPLAYSQERARKVKEPCKSLQDRTILLVLLVSRGAAQWMQPMGLQRRARSTYGSERCGLVRRRARLCQIDIKSKEWTRRASSNGQIAWIFWTILEMNCTTIYNNQIIIPINIITILTINSRRISTSSRTQCLVRLKRIT